LSNFLRPLHTPALHVAAARVDRPPAIYALAEAHGGKVPDFLPPRRGDKTNSWRIELPVWCADQRNQMTGPRPMTPILS